MPEESVRIAAAVVHVGPSRDAQGGISSVLSSLGAEGCFPGYDVTFAGTVQAQGPVATLAGFARAVAIALRALTQPQRIYQIHVASRGSFYRKVLVFSAATLRGHKTIIHLHGAGFDSFAAQAGPLTRRLIRWVFCRADVVLALSPEWRDRVAAFSGRSDALVVPNPVEIPARATEADRDEVLFLGRVGARKGVPELLEAARLVQEAGHTRTRWVIGGDGDIDAVAALRSRLPHPEVVEFPGWMSRDAVRDELMHARIFCLPSYKEGKPIALLEAMAYGLACVATPVGGVPDVLKDEYNGLVVPVGDSAALADALRRLITDVELRARLGKHARQSASEGYSVSTVCATLVDVYDGLRRGVVTR